jgi:hypothetical protein
LLPQSDPHASAYSLPVRFGALSNDSMTVIALCEDLFLRTGRLLSEVSITDSLLELNLQSDRNQRRQAQKSGTGRREKPVPVGEAQTLAVEKP